MLHGSVAGIPSLSFASIGTYLNFWTFWASVQRLLLPAANGSSNPPRSRSSTQLNPQRPVSVSQLLSPQVNEWLLGYRQVTFQSCCTTATINDRPNIDRLHAAQMSLRNNGFSLAAWRMHCFDSDIRGAQQLPPNMGLKIFAAALHAAALSAS